MAKDNHRGEDDLDAEGEESHAADEPTAVWDAEALRKAGLSELLDAPETPSSGPATPAMGFEVERPSMIIEEQLATRHQRTPAPRRPGSNVGWTGLIALACLLAAIAYALIRLLR